MATLYKKRAGTSGISGQLYETKLISLILYRLLHDDSIEDFYLASNMDDIGTFDDICVKIKIKGLDRPVLVLIQAKHKENDDKCLTFHNRNDLVKWSNSILKIKQQFTSSKNQNIMFTGKFDDTECLFILYTNAKYDVDPSYKYESTFSNHLNSLIATGSALGSRALYTEKDVQDIGATILNGEMTILAKRFAKYISDKSEQSMNILNEEYILRYHVVLAKCVVNVSETQSEEQNPDSKWRLLTFRHDFFKTNDQRLSLFKNQLYEEIIKYHLKTKNREEGNETLEDSAASDTTVDKQISSFLSEPSAVTLSPLIETHITYKLEKLRFISRRPHTDYQQLEQINIQPFVVDEAKGMMAREVLSTVKLKVPIAFGNIDVTIRGNQKKIERRLNHLMDIIVKLCQKAEQHGPFKVIVVDETVSKGVLSPNGGLGGAVGNILVNDENTNLLKFTDNNALLPNNARNLLAKLNNTINDLHDYRFKVRTMNFPKFSLDCTDMAKEFINKLVIYANQSNHYELEEILKQEIHNHHSTNLHFPVKTDAIFINYHNEVQNWWMAAKTGPYLTKTNNIFQRSINNIVDEPQMSALQNIFYNNNIKTIKYTYIEESTKLLQSLLEQNSRIIITTDIPTLTTIKVIQCLRNKYAILDLECILNLPIDDFTAFKIELKTTEKVLIVVCNITTSGRHLHKRLDQLAQATETKNIIIITNKAVVDTILEYFEKASVLNDETQKIIDLTPKSQMDVIKNTRVIFQGVEVSLNLLVDDVSITFIKDGVLSKIVNNELMVIGKPLSDANYEEIKHLFVYRKVSQNPYKYFERDDFYSEESYEEYAPSYLITTFYDINENVVLIAAKPGMGKSTLLTHLSLKTKELDKTLWIIRINLLEHSKQFYEWQKHKTVIDTLETLKFICLIVQRNSNIEIHLEEIDSKVYLKDCTGDEWVTFELNMFLHFYNKSNVIFIFDGFDEICPHYKNDVIKFFNVVRDYPRKNKMWVTSRPYADILPDLERILGAAYGIEYINTAEQDLYLRKLFETNLKFESIGKVQLNNIKSFLNFMLNRKQTMNSYTLASNTLLNQFSRIFYQFYAYLNSHFGGVFDKTIGKTNLPAAPFHVRRRDKFMGTPLLLYLFADYFLNLICDSGNINRWEQKISTTTIYEMFIETKLKNILFQDKNKMDVYKPDIIARYEKEYTACIDAHKKIAAFFMLGNPIYSSMFNFDEFNDMKPFNEDGEYITLINAIKSGTEKSGLISHIVPHNVPIFIHKTFEEYFAAGYLCDIFTSNKFTIDKKRLLYTILSCSDHYKLFAWICDKRDTDAMLDCVFNEIESTRPTVETWCDVVFESVDWRLENFAMLMSSAPDDYENDCFNKYDNDFFEAYLNTPESQRSLHISQIREDIIANMKPKLKKYFTESVPNNGDLVYTLNQ